MIVIKDYSRLLDALTERELGDLALCQWQERGKDFQRGYPTATILAGNERRECCFWGVPLVSENPTATSGHPSPDTIALRVANRLGLPEEELHRGPKRDSDGRYLAFTINDLARSFVYVFDDLYRDNKDPNEWVRDLLTYYRHYQAGYGWVAFPPVSEESFF